eukprot:Opistho-1_new@74074
MSFLITPVCSNASEIISSLIFAAKRRRTNISMTYGQLYGAATMNNTFCLGIFAALVYFRKLYWNYAAETTVIVLAQFIVGALAISRSTYKVWYGFPIAAIYFGSIGLVALLESSAVGWN